MVMHRWDEVLFAQSTSNAPIKNTASAEYREGLYPAFSATGQDVWLPTHRYEGRGIVVSAVGARCGKSFKADGKWNVVANTHALYVNEDIALRDYCWYALNNEEWWIKAGSGQPFVKLKDSLKRKHCFPPIEEQKQIVKVLDEVAQLISLRKEQLAKLDQLVKSRFIELFGDMLLNDMAWQESTLDTLSDVVSGITKGRKIRETELIEVPYMAVSNVKDGYIDWTTVKTILATKQEIEQYRLLPYDVLMTEGGDPDKLGRGAVITKPLENSIHQNHIFRVRLQAEKILPVYFSEYLQHQKAKRYFLRCAKQTTGIASINMKQLRALPVLVPPLELQEQFAAFVEQTDKSKLAIQQSLDKLELLKKSLMQEYFG